MKKYSVISIIGILTLSFLVFSVPTGIAAPLEEGSSDDTLLVGTTSFGSDLDPQNAWDSASFDIIDQVSEALFAYDLGDKYLRIVPRLAADCGEWSDDNLEFTVSLREGVTFHNGKPFDADAVKASFDRLNHLVELGELQTAELYEPIDTDGDGYGELVIGETVVVSEFVVKFVLNYEFVPFIPLLCFGGSMIVDASVMPEDTILTPEDDLIGTGPYKFMGNDGEKVDFEFYEDYYHGVPSVKKLSFVMYQTSSAISTALLAGDIHMGGYDPDFLISFYNSEILTVEPPKAGSIITYMGMNNILIDKPMRQAISYAMDYEYIIASIYRNLIVRMTSVVPPGIAFHKPQEVATYDVEAARAIIIAEGLSQGLDADSEDDEWVDLAESGNPVAYYNYTYNLGNVIREDIGVETQYDLSLIGIEVELTGVTWIEFLYKLFYYPYELNLYLIGWMPDYNDPSNYINPLFSNTSMSNSAQVNDPWLMDKMTEGLSEFDDELRQELYYDIQEYIATDLMPWVFIGFNNGVSVHSTDVTDLQRNAMGYFYVFPLTWYGDEAEWDEEVWCNTGSALPNATDLERTSPGIPGYSAIVMLGVAVPTIIAIIKKKQK